MWDQLRSCMVGTVLCAASRLISRILTGEDRVFCAIAHERNWRIRHAIDLACIYRDGPDHCLRMRVHDDRLEKVRQRGYDGPRAGQRV